jgi:Holliday junction resolvase RusA-like endonuclease
MKIVLWVDPTPASRPRVSRKGFAYYGKTYERYRREAKAALGAVKKPKGCPLSGPLKVKIAFYCRSPKKPSNTWPIGDIDNHIKSILDSLNGWAWEDDVQIMWIEATKQYSANPRIEIEWEEYREQPQRIGVSAA